MRILHTSDWHLGKSLEQINRQINRIDEQREFIECLCKIVEEERIDLVLVSGDVYDTYNPPTAAEELFYDAVDKLNARGRRAVVVIAGNHDNPERLCAASPLAYKNGIILLGYPGSDPGTYKINTDNIKLVNSGPGWLELGIAHCNESAVILTLPYPSEARLEEVLTREADEELLQKAYSDKVGNLLGRLKENFRKDTINLAMSHLFMRGGRESESERTIQVGGAFTVDPSVLPSNAHFVALGHLHRPQWVKNAPCPACYSGSPLAYSFSEADYSKALYIIDAEPGKEADIKEIFLDCGKPLKRWQARDGIMQAFEWCETGRDKNAWIDLEIITDRPFTAEEQKKLRQLHPGIINIRPVLKNDITEEIAFENREGRKIDQLFREFYKLRTGTEISEELMSVFLEVLNEGSSDEGSDEILGEIEYETQIS
ncbi:MAG: exonuclease SbcCD subunit D [Firmicutes bacterium]|nr:exonuclease SbcCD subunit D [Bacillota bacterium]